MNFTVCRRPNQWRLRKWNIVLHNSEGGVLDQRFMFGGPGFEKRLTRKIRRMIKMRKIADEVIKAWT